MRQDLHPLRRRPLLGRPHLRRPLLAQMEWSSSYEPNSINVFAWGDILDPAVIADFEKETGIKVNLNYYSSNEELIVKLKATRGEGYDLIIPSDYAVKILIKEDLLKPIDQKPPRFLAGPQSPSSGAFLRSR